MHAGGDGSASKAWQQQGAKVGWGIWCGRRALDQSWVYTTCLCRRCNDSGNHFCRWRLGWCGRFSFEQMVPTSSSSSSSTQPSSLNSHFPYSPLPPSVEGAGIGSLGHLILAKFGKTIQMLRAVGLLASGLVATLCLTYAGQIIMVGLLQLEVRPCCCWSR